MTSGADEFKHESTSVCFSITLTKVRDCLFQAEFNYVCDVGPHCSESQLILSTIRLKTKHIGEYLIIEITNQCCM